MATNPRNQNSVPPAVAAAKRAFPTDPVNQRFVNARGEPWMAVAKIMNPETEADAALTADFRRMIQGDESAWIQYLKKGTG